MPKYVYILQSEVSPDQHYIGITEELKSRLDDHNSGNSKHTAKFRPWKIIVAVYFKDTEKAHAFERYLKSGSGRAFAMRHFL